MPPPVGLTISLTNVLLTATCPVLMAPAMHTEMWLHPATPSAATLRERGVIVLDPASGRLTGEDTGPGRLPDPVDIHSVATSLVADEATVEACRARDLTGRHVVVSAGGTREQLPVRYLGNASSGLEGVAIARAAALREASVTLVAASVTADLPSGSEIVRVGSTADPLAREMTRLASSADVIVMAAAPADFTVERKCGQDQEGRRRRPHPATPPRPPTCCTRCRAVGRVHGHHR